MIDESKLDRLQATARWLALLSLAVFAALIAFSAYKLYDIQRELRENAEKLKGQEQTLRDNETRLAELQGEIAELEQARKALSGAIKDFTARVGAKDPELALSATRQTIEANPAAADVLPRIYVQIRSESQRAPAGRVAERFRESDFLVPGIENVGARSPRVTELRYFRRADERGGDLRAILAALKDAGVVAQPKYVPGFEESQIVRRRQYELWFGEDFPPASPSRPPARTSRR